VKRTYRAAVGGTAAVLLATTLSACGESQASWIGKKYHKIGYNTFQSSQPPRTVASAINRKFKAIDQVDDLARYGSGGGVFLR
jgi:hypothetical protein